MKNKRLYGVLFICLFCLITFLIETLLRDIPNDYHNKKLLIEDKKAHIETLILGSSHAYVGLNPAVFSSPTFNLAYSSQTIDLDEKLFNAYKNKLPKLKNVLLPISYFSYVLALEDGSSADKIKNYNIYYSVYSHTHLLKNQLEILHESLEKNFTRFEQYYLKNQSEIKIDQNGFIAKRFIKPKMDLNERANHAIQNHQKNLQDPLIQQRIIENIQSIENIAIWCQNNQVQLVLISTPTTPNYVQQLEQKQLLHWRNTTMYLAKKYPTTITWLNYLEHNESFDSIDFQDADHLSAQGAEKLSKLVEFQLKQNSK